ncbi:putative metal-binding motif-containing protein, partial [Candidatus Woesearchaeota archaeon]|nr:putative metal-binding motif-containing protein [Candidatus Woesearchaeota archaeon]
MNKRFIFGFVCLCFLLTLSITLASAVSEDFYCGAYDFGGMYSSLITVHQVNNPATSSIGCPTGYEMSGNVYGTDLEDAALAFCMRQYTGGDSLYLFGGMYTVDSYVNPLTGDYTCPENYTDYEVILPYTRFENVVNPTTGLVESIEINVDPSVHFCYQENNATNRAIAFFGGVYSTGYANPATGSESCPTYYNSYKVAGSSNDKDLYFCYLERENGLIEDPIDGRIYNYLPLQSEFLEDFDGDGFGIEDTPGDEIQTSIYGCYVPYDYEISDEYAQENTLEFVPPGYTDEVFLLDCNDTNASINPGANDFCGVDLNCDGVAILTNYTFFRDADGDGLGNEFDTISDCSAPEGYVNNPNDCDDNYDTCTDNCEKLYFEDLDSDGFGKDNITSMACQGNINFAPFDGDCNDDNASINPIMEDICGNNIDDNCDGVVDENCCYDADGLNFYTRGVVIDYSGGEEIMIYDEAIISEDGTNFLREYFCDSETSQVSFVDVICPSGASDGRCDKYISLDDAGFVRDGYNCELAPTTFGILNACPKGTLIQKGYNQKQYTCLKGPDAESSELCSEGECNPTDCLAGYEYSVVFNELGLIGFTCTEAGPLSTFEGMELEATTCGPNILFGGEVREYNCVTISGEVGGTCFDSDEGLDPRGQKGITTILYENGTKAESYEDTCADINTLIYHECVETNAFAAVNTLTIDCPPGSTCLDGTCINELIKFDFDLYDVGILEHPSVIEAEGDITFEIFFEIMGQTFSEVPSELRSGRTTMALSYEFVDLTGIVKEYSFSLPFDTDDSYYDLEGDFVYNLVVPSSIFDNIDDEIPITFRFDKYRQVFEYNEFNNDYALDPGSGRSCVSEGGLVFSSDLEPDYNPCCNDNGLYGFIPLIGVDDNFDSFKPVDGSIGECADGWNLTCGDGKCMWDVNNPFTSENVYNCPVDCSNFQCHNTTHCDDGDECTFEACDIGLGLTNSNCTYREYTEEELLALELSCDYTVPIVNIIEPQDGDMPYWDFDLIVEVEDNNQDLTCFYYLATEDDVDFDSPILTGRVDNVNGSFEVTISTGQECINCRLVAQCEDSRNVGISQTITLNITQERCGDGLIDPSESCDGENFAGLDCSDFDGLSDFPFQNALSCDDTCNIDSSGCSGSGIKVCGDGIIALGETCDYNSTNVFLSGLTCQDFGFDRGTLSCGTGCLINTSACYFETPCETNSDCDSGNSCNNDLCIAGECVVVPVCDGLFCQDASCVE